MEKFAPKSCINFLEMVEMNQKNGINCKFGFDDLSFYKD